MDAEADEVVLDKLKWLLGHDAEKHACEVWEQVKLDIETNGYHFPDLP
jgi:hypothetical protein